MLDLTHRRDDSPRRPLSLPEPQAVESEKARKAVAERSEAHRRWIADDGDVACRGID
jgi:hypothetical protein